MKRRSFLRISGISAGSLIFMGSIAEFLASCAKRIGLLRNGDTFNQPVYITEENLVTPFQTPVTFGTNATFIPQTTKAKIIGNQI